MKFLSLKKGHKIVIGILLFIAIVLFAAPRVARWYIVKHSREYTGRNIEIGKIRVGYFTGTLRIHDLKLFEDDGKTVFLSFKKFKVNLDYLPLLKNEIHVKHVSLDDPYVQVLQNGSKFNFDDIGSSSDTTAAKTDTIPSKPTKYVINNITISGGYVKYTDMELKHTIAMNNLDLKIPGFTWNSDSTNLNVDLHFVDGGGLYSKLAVNQADSTYSINLKLDSLNLNIIEPYVKSSMYISSLHGWLSNDIIIKGSMQSVMKLFIKGMNHVYGFQMTDTLNRTILSFNDLAVDIDTVLMDKNRYDLNSVSLTDPFILFEMIDSTNNWMALMKPSPETPADSTHQPADTAVVSSEFSYTFPRLDITGGKVLFSDKTMRYPFDFNIDNLKVSCTEAPGKPGKLALKVSAGLNGTGTMSADAIINPENTEDLSFTMDIGQFRMKDVEPYFMHYLGYPVTGGIMNFKTEDLMKPKSLESNNRLYFRKFTLAQRTDQKCEYKVPVRLALGVLSDKNGIIDLKAPIESKGDEVKIRNLGKIIFRIIGNLFIKAAVAPFNALAGSYKVDPAALQEIRLELMETAPNEENMKSVDVIADILTNKPGLNIDFYYVIDRIKASDSLAYILSVEDFKNFSKNNSVAVRNVPDSILLKYLLNKPSSAQLQNNPQLSLLCRQYIGQAKLMAEIDSLRNNQTAFISNYLGHDKALPAGRFRVTPVAPDTIKPPLNYPAFRTYFTSGE
jgi:hypothetical protein